jgi:uncharacterized membrane protein
MEGYLSLKLIHILSSTVLFGTGLGTAFAMWRADVGGDPRVIASVARNVVLADWLFTTPAVIVQPLTGLLLLGALGLPWSTSWVAVSLLLYLLIGACWLPVVWIQLQVAADAAAAVRQGAPLPPRHRRLMRAWYALGWPAFAGVLAVFPLMVFKPALW